MKPSKLRGIQDELKAEPAWSGRRSIEYTPHGDQGYAYSMRRIEERPSNFWLLLRSIFYHFP